MANLTVSFQPYSKLLIKAIYWYNQSMSNYVNLYIHIPYCKVRCKYCSFYIRPGTPERVADYFSAMKKELLWFKDSHEISGFTTIYLGGGTPSFVEVKEVEDLIDFIHDNFGLSQLKELAVETNPEDITKDKLSRLLKKGMTRLSIGLQAWQNSILKDIGRQYTNEEFVEKIKIVKDLGIINFNIDLIFGFQGHNIEEWIESLEKVIAMNPNHISTYSLEVGDDSTFGLMKAKGKYSEIEDEGNRQMYAKAREMLGSSGYVQYEISNFSKPGFQSQHNLDFWEGNDYIGIGASAVGRLNSVRKENVRSLEKYIRTISDSAEWYNEIKLSSADLAFELLLVGLRDLKGIDVTLMNKKHGIDLYKFFEEKLKISQKNGLLEISETTIKLTEKGLDLQNQVVDSLI